jgi:hypothetical protein
MCFEHPANYLGLEEVDNTCSHGVLSLLHACSLYRLDNRTAEQNHDYMKDPNSDKVLPQAVSATGNIHS